ncbi:RNA methyltransferase [Acididesulfobacillus acetoxydans]|uniref:RNA methyltransferase n=1 Tax=Acididesulfobacillus acetoxydans TaxID=1561005 RepID=UPI001F112590|nr:RNA methyltransferase [Acididesulfobacillus acetoxydans]
MGELYLALVHAPVYNKNGAIVATSITNLDLHDIARAAATFGVKRYYVVHPAEAQQALARRIMGFWQEGFGAEYNPDRREAFTRVRLVANLDEAAAEIRESEGQAPLLVATDAGRYPNTVAYPDLRRRLEEEDRPFLLLFGTGWGLLPRDVANADLVLAPVFGPDEYNHLSVRSAAAIILDRLRGH